MTSPAQRKPNALRDSLLLLLLTFSAVAIHGYHYGVQDQFLYLPAIKLHVNPALYPHDRAFFQIHTRAMLLDDVIGFFVRITHLPVDWSVFVWQILSLYVMLLGCLRVSRRCFQTRSAEWAATVSVAVMLTLEVAGTLLFLADEYLHPRTLATALLLFGLAAVLDRKLWAAAAWVIAAALIHPTMAAAGALHLVCISWRPNWKGWAPPTPVFPSILLAIPFLGGTNDAWREVMATRWYLYPAQWPWYAWLGVVVPVALLAWFVLLEQGAPGPVSYISRRLIFSGLFGAAVALIISITPGLERLIPAEPMRTLHLFTLMTVLLGGGVLGERFLRDRPLRWALVFLPLSAAMFLPQLLVLYPHSPHIEWPGRIARDDWTEAFEWARQNTPIDAYFVLNTRYQEIKGEDYHDFRGLAERSALADFSKDRGVVANWPELAPAWREQVHDRDNWENFTLGDYERLKAKYGVTWTVIEASNASARALSCPYQKQALRICRIP